MISFCLNGTWLKFKSALSPYKKKKKRKKYFSFICLIFLFKNYHFLYETLSFNYTALKMVKYTETLANFICRTRPLNILFSIFYVHTQTQKQTHTRAYIKLDSVDTELKVLVKCQYLAYAVIGPMIRSIKDNKHSSFINITK